MRVPIPHTLGKDEVKRRLRERSGEMAGLFPGGKADVAIRSAILQFEIAK